jgi:hypothetical protein
VDNVWLAETEDLVPVFHYAGIPVRFCLSQRPVTAMVAVDAMTAPEHRRRGLLTAAFPLIHSAWRDHGIPFVLGLPNEQWGSRIRALGWQPLFPLRWMVRPLRPMSYLARRLKVSPLERGFLMDAWWNRLMQSTLRRDPALQTERVTNADEGFDRIWARCRGEKMFSTMRDRAWVQWRFLASPMKEYRVTLARLAGEPKGYCVHRLVAGKNHHYAVLAEMFFSEHEPRVRNALLCDLIEDLLAAKADALMTLAVPGTRYYRWLRRCGFLPRAAFSVELIALAQDLPLETMRRGENWNLTGADFDVV